MNYPPVYRKLNIQFFVVVFFLILAAAIIFGAVKSFAESNTDSQDQQNNPVNQSSEKADDKTAKNRPSRWLTVDEKEFEHIQTVVQSKGGDDDLEIVEKRGGLSVIKASESQILDLSRNMHAEFHKCGGFMSHESLEAARSAVEEAAEAVSNQQLIEYTINNQSNVAPMLSETKEAQIREIITRLSTDFPNRRYNQPSGMNSANWIKNKWTQLAAGRGDITVEFFNHPATVSPQPSIILTVQGTTFPNEVVVLGGHQDSINLNGATLDAPGADDDASGIASLTETIRVLVAKNFRPQRTVKFMAYAAEEIGLVGSNAIAADFKTRGVNVVGVLQLDMTNFKHASSPYDIAIVTDLTNAAQNDFLRNLISTYQPALTVGNSTCGYGCSDHASWNNKGFPASFPFEGIYSNPTIHTVNDTLAQSGNTAFHAVKFTNLALSYVGELAKGTLGSTPATPTPTVAPSPTVSPTPTITPTPTPGIKTNVASASSGAVASASSQMSDAFAPSFVINGGRTWTSGGWKDATADNFPDWLQVDFAGNKTINEIDVYAVADDYSSAVEPTESTTFSVYGITSFEVQYWTGAGWTTVPGGSIANTNKVLTKIVFPAVTTSRIRVVINSGQAGYSRIVELEAWSGGANPTPTPVITPTPMFSPTPLPSPTATMTPMPTPGIRTNVALATNSGIASASSSLGGGAPGIAIDGIKNWATTGAWKDATPDAYPDVLQIDFAGSKTINEIDVYAVKDDFGNSSDPTESATFSFYGITNFDVQYRNGTSWTNVPNGSVSNNNKVVTKLVFPAITTTAIRVVVYNAQANYSRIVEIEAWSDNGNATPTPTPAPTPNVRTNVASATGGAIATASSFLQGGTPDRAIDGIRNWATSGAWKDSTPDIYPDILQVDFAGSKTINEIDVFAVKDDYWNSSDPAETDVFSVYGITNFEAQYWNGASWITVPGGAVGNNNKVITKLTFAPVTTTKIRIVVTGAQSNYSRIVELEAWSDGN